MSDLTKINADRVGAIGPTASALIERLVPLAVKGLTAAYVPDSGGYFPQTMRGHDEDGARHLHAEGRSARYTAMALLGLNRLPHEAQKDVLAGAVAVDKLSQLKQLSISTGDAGALALAAWASAEIAGAYDADLIGTLARIVESGTPLPTVDLSWMLTAALCSTGCADAETVIATARERLLQEQGPQGTFPHLLPSSAQRLYRRHIGTFADQVYPLQALARLHAARDDQAALFASEKVAQRITMLQGNAGQWWWFYDSRNGQVVEPYPVYSVHQHAMAPMVLFDLRSAGGTDHSAAIASGLSWLQTHPETDAELVDDELGVVWRKVGRREVRKLARGINSATTAVRQGARLSLLDRLMPPGPVDHECRPYELGWLLYAWLDQA